MDSGQLPEPEPPEPPDLSSSPVRASLSNRSSSTIKVFISINSFYIVKVSISISIIPLSSEEAFIFSSHLLALASSTKSFLSLDLDLEFFQILVYFVSRILWFPIFSMSLASWIFELGSLNSLPETGWLVFIIGSFSDLLNAVCSLITGLFPGSSISSCYNIVFPFPLKIFQVHLSSLLFSAYSSSVDWDKKLFVWVTIELRNRVLVSVLLMDIASVGSSFVTFDGLCIASVRFLTVVCSLLTAVCSFIVICSSLIVFSRVVVAGCLYFSFWWQLKEKFIDILSWMSMIMVGIHYPFVSCLEQLLFPIFLRVWSELDEQVSLVLKGSSSQQMLFSAFGAVCVVLRVTLDAIFQEAYQIVVMLFCMVSFYDLYRHSISYFTRFLVCLAPCSLLYPPLMEFKLF